MRLTLPFAPRHSVAAVAVAPAKVLLFLTLPTAASAQASPMHPTGSTAMTQHPAWAFEIEDKSADQLGCTGPVVAEVRLLRVGLLPLSLFPFR